MVVLGGVAVSYERGTPVTGIPSRCQGEIRRGIQALCVRRELIPTLGALFPRGVPVQDPVLTEREEGGDAH